MKRVCLNRTYIIKIIIFPLSSPPTNSDSSMVTVCTFWIRAGLCGRHGDARTCVQDTDVELRFEGLSETARGRETKGERKRTGGRDELGEGELEHELSLEGDCLFAKKVLKSWMRSFPSIHCGKRDIIIKSVDHLKTKPYHIGRTNHLTRRRRANQRRGRQRRKTYQDDQRWRSQTDNAATHSEHCSNLLFSHR